MSKAIHSSFVHQKQTHISEKEHATNTINTETVIIKGEKN